MCSSNKQYYQRIHYTIQLGPFSIKDISNRVTILRFTLDNVVENCNLPFDSGISGHRRRRSFIIELPTCHSTPNDSTSDYHLHSLVCDTTNTNLYHSTARLLHTDTSTGYHSKFDETSNVRCCE